MNDRPQEVPRAPGVNAPVHALSTWLIEQAFGDPAVEDVFASLCERLLDMGLPVDRAYFAWPTLHPLIDAESFVWRPGAGVSLETHPHDNIQSDQWRRSPMRYVIENDLGEFRLRLDDPSDVRFPLLLGLAAEGFTDYVLFATRYSVPRVDEDGEPGGVLVSYATKRPGGFTDTDVAVFRHVQGRLAIAAKTMALSRVTRNITDAYLGRIAGRRVLSGQIRHGDGEAIEAIVWYSDLRNSTVLAEAMPEADYIRLLNLYFECTAGAALAHGGEVLDFIGDAVLAIFPCTPVDGSDVPNGRDSVARTACLAIREANRRRREILAGDPALPLDFGIGIDAGRLMFGNIGVPERLAFSVIGPTVNRVARIEKKTKGFDTLALATEHIAAAVPECWRAVGPQHLPGVSEPVPLFAWEPQEGSDR